MEIRIGIVQSMREIEVELPEGTDQDQIRAEVAAALSSGAVIWLTDRKGRRVGVPAERVAYVEFTTGNERVVGFGAN